jgi:hypothetical protein
MNYYKIIFAMAQHHKYTVTELENMIPYELDIYVGLLTQYLEEKKQEQQKQASKRR